MLCNSLALRKPSWLLSRATCNSLKYALAKSEQKVTEVSSNRVPRNGTCSALLTWVDWALYPKRSVPESSHDRVLVTRLDSFSNIFQGHQQVNLSVDNPRITYIRHLNVKKVLFEFE